MKTSTYLPLPGSRITRKRRRHWKRQILRAHPGLNPAWLDARYEMRFIFAPSPARGAQPLNLNAGKWIFNGGAEPVRLSSPRVPVSKFITKKSLTRV
jgi:hypothetical protein